MRRPESIKDQGQSLAAGAVEEQYSDIEAQPFASERTTTTNQPSSLQQAYASWPCDTSRDHERPNEAAPSTSSSITVPFEVEEELPPEKYSRPFRAARWAWLTVYHRLCLLVLLPNVIVMATLAAKHNLFKIPMPDLATAVAANIAAAIMMRQEVVINILFILAGKCPQSTPLRLRRLLAKIYHFGGVHSGAGIAATIWFTLFNATLLWAWQTNAIPGLPKDKFPFEVSITIVIDFLLIMIMIFAHPKLRRAYHNGFECVHRFAGWLAVALFWIYLVVLTALLEQSRAPRRPLGAALLHSPAIYLLMLVTLFLILPWLRLRKVSVWVEPLSTHAARWHFRYTNVDLCVAARVSDSPLKEWHSFASIPEPDGSGFSLIVSNAGDWTKRMIHHPPTKLWVRGIPAHGVLHIAPIFKQIVLVATGSGIGPVLSLLAARDVACRVLWSARSPLSTYKKNIVDEVFLGDPGALVYDTTVVAPKDRPDLLKLTYRLYRDSKAEAVFVISNQKVTEKLVFGLESRGIPTFAPIFDS
jgi:hypothetical protein